MPGPRIVILNPFDPLWGEEDREARYPYLARRLAENGFAVTYVTSDWSHRMKRHRDAEAIARAAGERGVHVEFVETLPYRVNTSLRRLRSHARFSKDAATALEALSPGVVVVGTPPPQLADRVVTTAHRLGVPVVVDIQDLWPEEFDRFWPRGFKWFNKVAFHGMVAAFRRACAGADAVVGVAEKYVAQACRFGAPARREVVHIGVDVHVFDESAQRGRNLLADAVSEGRQILFWGGTIASGTDWAGVIEAVARLVPEHPSVLLAVLGTGPDVNAMQAYARDRGIEDHFRYLGFQPYDAYAATLAASDVALNAWHPTTEVAFPNRAFEFMAAGVAVVNTLGGEFGELVASQGIGLNCPAGSAAGLAEAVRLLLADGDLRGRMGRNARRLAKERFDRKHEYEGYLSLCEELAASAQAQKG